MENKKEVLKTTIIIVIIIVIVIYNFVLKKDELEDLNYSELVVNENIEKDKVEEIEKIKVYVIGQVNKPGVIELEYGARLEDAIILAGGTTEESDLSKINLACSLEDGQKIYIPSINEKNSDEYIITQNNDGIIEQSNISSYNNNNSKININTGDIDELSNLPGVGKALAQRIIVYREENGKFKKIEDLKNVSGIGDKKYENLKEYICIK